jgi:two-component system OmpR family sensor kinase
MRGNPFFRRMGCLFVVSNLVGLIVFGIVVGLFIGVFGRGGDPTNPLGWVMPVGGILVAFVISMSILAVRNIRRMSSPLDELLDASNRVAVGDFSARVGEKGPPEVRLLLRGFNSMAENLETNDKQRRNMLADISHELRSPITVMQGNLEGMIDGVYSADADRLQSLYEETQILERLVDDLRTLSLAESGSLRLERETTDLGGLIRDTVARFETQIKEKDIQIEMALANVDEIEVDPLRIREVLMNLLANAVRYTPRQGEIKVGLAESGWGGERDALSLSKRSVTIFVQDSGEGIQAANLGQIFDRFYKSSDSGGMGLGLSIAKYLVEAHGGKIWADSATEQGTKISFMLPK